MMLSKFRTAFADESGQGMTEYIIIVALIAIAAIGVVTMFGNNIRALFGNSVDALSGDNGHQDSKIKKASPAVTKHRRLNNFSDAAKVK